MAYPDPVDNPFTMIHNAIWEMATNNTILQQWLSKRNQIDFLDNLGEKPTISFADTPELSLLTQATFSNLMNTSSTTFVTKSYSWVMVTSEYNINDIFNQVSWELFRTMTQWDTVLCQLTWGSQPASFVKELRMQTSSEGINFSEEMRELQGWALTWPFEVDCHFPTVDLRIS